MTHERQLQDFEGRWILSRRIVQAGGGDARFEGEARFLPVPEGLRYEETGQLLLPGQVPMTATRVYLWDDQLRVSFEDGRFFHQVPAGGGDADHWCAPDSYAVSYDFAGWPKWTAEWTVRGPRKDYRMVSRYLRG